MIERGVAKYHDDPNLYVGSTAQPMQKALMSGISHKHGGTKTNKVEKVDLADLELRSTRKALKNLAEMVDRPEDRSEFQFRYHKFLNVVSHYNKTADKWDQPHGMVKKLRELRDIDSYQSFEAWLLAEMQSEKNLNWLHELWMASSMARKIINRTHAIRIGHWLTLFFNFFTFQANRPMVSTDKVIRIHIMLIVPLHIFHKLTNIMLRWKRCLESLVYLNRL